MLGARVHVDITIPRTSIAGKMRLISRSESFEATAEARRFLVANGFPTEGELSSVASLGTSDEWQMEMIARTLQKAIRDPRNTALELAPIEEWRDCDDDQLLSLWRDYKDLGTRIDPIGTKVLNEQQVALLEEFAKKKDPELLMDFGSRILALWSISLVDQRGTSATPSS